MSTAQANCQYDGTLNDFTLRTQVQPVESYIMICTTCGFKNCIWSEGDGKIVQVVLCNSNF